MRPLTGHPVYHRTPPQGGVRVLSGIPDNGAADDEEAMCERHIDPARPPEYRHAAHEVCPRCYLAVDRGGYPMPENRDCVEDAQ